MLAIVENSGKGYSVQILSFIFQLAGSVMMLLFAVRMVRTGIERAFGSAFQRLLTAPRNPLMLAPLGILLACVLQSSAAVTLLVAGFSGAGALSFVPGIAIVLGGDLGSAMLIQVLSLRLDWLIPVLLTTGGFLFLKTDQRSLKQAGRILLGIAFILVSLSYLRQTMEPFRESAFLPAVAGYLAQDFVTAFLVGVILAFVMHSSVAAILMIVAVVDIGAISLATGLSLVLGANAGSALIPVWLSRGMEPVARRVPVANMLLRGSGAILAVSLLNSSAGADVFLASGDPAQTLITVHIAFNAALLLTVPFAVQLEAPVAAIFPKNEVRGEELSSRYRSVLNRADLASPSLALAGLRREVLRMAGLVEEMTAPVMDLYRRADEDTLERQRGCEDALNSALNEVRNYSAEIDQTVIGRELRAELRALVDYAIALEAAGDIVVKRLVPLTQEKHRSSLEFSPAGFSELLTLHAKAMSNLDKATNVLIGSDLEGARLLLEEKAEIARIERNSRKKHLKRLAEGELNSFRTSDLHLETAYSFKEFHSWIVTVAHPILQREGQLLETRLIRKPEPARANAKA